MEEKEAKHLKGGALKPRVLFVQLISNQSSGAKHIQPRCLTVLSAHWLNVFYLSSFMAPSQAQSHQCRSPSQWWGFTVAAFSDGHLIPPLPKETHIIQFAAKKRIKMLIRLRPNNLLK